MTLRVKWCPKLGILGLTISFVSTVISSDEGHNSKGCLISLRLLYPHLPLGYSRLLTS